MIKETLYHKTVDILVQAYFNDMLLHRDCAACAVGNIILASHNLYPLIGEKEGLRWPHDKLEFSDKVSWYGIIGLGEEPDDYANKLISKTGYSWNELEMIENAFEAVRFGSGDVIMFDSLMAVIDVLDEIHENKSTETTQTSKSKFKKHAIYE